MIPNKMALSLLTLVLVLTCVGIANAQETPFNERPAVISQEVIAHPEQAARRLADDYFSRIQSQGERDGAALLSYSIIDVDASDLNDIKVTVNLSYADVPPIPNVVYHVVTSGDYYVVQNQFCAYNVIPNSPRYGSVICGPKITSGKDTYSINWF